MFYCSGLVSQCNLHHNVFLQTDDVLSCTGKLVYADIIITKEIVHKVQTQNKKQTFQQAETAEINA